MPEHTSHAELPRIDLASPHCPACGFPLVAAAIRFRAKGGRGGLNVPTYKCEACDLFWQQAPSTPVAPSAKEK